MVDVKSPSECSGCTACMAVCPHNAITMQPDVLGFKYPKVDKKRCTNCGLCEKICPFNDSYEFQPDLDGVFQSYAARHKKLNEIELSRSGAVFAALTDIVLEQGGVVYGAGFSANDFQVIHKRATVKCERDEFRGSKYVQSELGTIFYQVKHDLRSGLKVLFSGTPCQTAGLNAFIGKKLRSNLYLVDIICHGVAAPSVWSDYLSYLEDKEKDKIISVNFRDKKIFGWSGLHKESFVFAHKGMKTFNYTFYHPYMLRKSCNKCYFCNLRRPSDITLGDLWGWEKVVPNFNVDDKGVSLVLCNSEKGRKMFDSVSSMLNFMPVDIEHCMQYNLKCPTPVDPNRDCFEMDYKSHGFVYVMKKYGDVGVSFQLKRIVNSVLRRLKNTKRR